MHNNSLKDEDYKKYIKYVENVMSGGKEEEDDSDGYLIGEEDQKEKSIAAIGYSVKDDVRAYQAVMSIEENPLRKKAMQKCAAYKAWKMNKVAKKA